MSDPVYPPDNKGPRGRRGRMGPRGFQGDQGTFSDEEYTTMDDLVAARQATVDDLHALRRSNYWKLLVGFLVVMFIFGALAYRQEQNTNAVEKTAETARDNSADIRRIQNVTSRQVLCPLYTLFLDSATQVTPDQVDTQKEQDLFNSQVKIILDGYNTLKCTPHREAPQLPTP